MEQLKSIKKELGMERDDKNRAHRKVYETFRAQARERAGRPPPRLSMKELQKARRPRTVVERIQRHSQLSRVAHVTAVGRGAATKKLDISHAQESVLDSDHYGLEDVKDRILEFIAVGANFWGRRKEKSSPWSVRLGWGRHPSGNRSPRRSGRKFYRFSVGGMSDVAEIKGHRRTYVGAMPGKLIQCLKSTGVCNPVVLIDEIDKLGRGYQGDPASALLELLDPEQKRHVSLITTSTSPST